MRLLIAKILNRLLGKPHRVLLDGVHITTIFARPRARVIVDLRRTGVTLGKGCGSLSFNPPLPDIVDPRATLHITYLADR